MERIRKKAGIQVYLDTNIFIYAIEEYNEYIRAVARIFDLIDKKHFKAITSELTLSEVLVKPIQNKKTALQKIYKDTIQSSDLLEVMPINRKILLSASHVRATNSKLNLPDAIHCATAQEANCEILFTNDKNLGSVFNQKWFSLAELSAVVAEDPLSLLCTEQSL